MERCKRKLLHNKTLNHRKKERHSIILQTEYKPERMIIETKKIKERTTIETKTLW